LSYFAATKLAVVYIVSTSQSNKERVTFYNKARSSHHMVIAKNEDLTRKMGRWHQGMEVWMARGLPERVLQIEQT
jgi:hypothetical protein